MRHPAVILHLSHTDIRCDARILRQLDALRHLSGVRVAAIGVESGEDAARGAHDDGVRIETVRVMSKQFTLLPRPLRYVINLCELVCRVLPRAVLHRPSVVHCHDTLVLPLGWVTSLLTGAALVYDAHELECHKSGQGRLLSSGTAILEWFCWSQVSLLISVSPAIIDWYQQRYGSKRSVLVLNSPLLSSPAPTKTGRMDIEGRSARYFHRRFGVPAATPVFVYLGLLVPGRGIERVLQAFGESGIRSHVVFMGYEDRVGVAEQARRHPNIHVHPAVPHEQVVGLVREADCGLCLIEDVSLSDRLCLPNKLFEYAFAGIPVLASRLPEIARVVETFGLGRCCDNDASSIAEAVRRIEREGLGPPSGDLAELSWHTQATRLCSCYQELLGERESPVPSAEKGAI